MSLDLLECVPCETDLPVVADEGCELSLKYGEVSYILVANVGQPFANIQNASEHTTRYSATSTDEDAIRKIRCVGTIGTEFGSDIEVGSLTTIPGPNNFTLTVKVYDNQDENYDFARATACNREYLVWAITSSGMIYGGNDGIRLVLKGREVVPEDFKQLTYIEISGKKTMTRIPLRDTYPLAVEL